MTRVLYLLLAVVAAAAAVLSFDALLGLAVLCGFTPVLAWLLPLTVDAGAAAGSLAWLGRPPGAARRFGRALALTLLGGSVAGNALSHGLTAYGVAPTWWTVVAVSAIPPAVLGATVHLAVLAGRGSAPSDSPVQVVAESDASVPTPGLTRSESGPARTVVPQEVEDLDRPEGGAGEAGDTAACTPDRHASGRPEKAAGDEGTQPVRTPDPVAELIASGAGRRRLARELEISEHAARELLDQHRNGHQAVSR